MSIYGRSLDEFYNNRKAIDEGFLDNITGKAPLSKESDFFPKSKVLSDAKAYIEKVPEDKRSKESYRIINSCIYVCKCAVSYDDSDPSAQYLPKYDQGTLPELTKILKNYIGDYKAKILDTCNKSVIELEKDIETYNKKGSKEALLHGKMAKLRIEDFKKCIAVFNTISESNYFDYEEMELTEAEISEYVNELSINEAVDMDEGFGGKLRPVFIVLTYSDSTFAKGMNKVFKGDKQQTYWHVSLGFGPSLARLYSFNNNIEAHTNKFKGGLSFESYSYYNKQNPNGLMEVNCLFVTDEKYKALKKTLNYYIDNKDRTKYDTKNILWMYLNKATKSSNNKPNLVCSTFVNTILKSAGIKLSSKEDNLVMPDDLRKTESNEKQFKLFEGKIGEFDANKLTEEVSKLADDVSNDYFGGKENKTKVKEKQVSESLVAESILDLFKK